MRSVQRRGRGDMEVQGDGSHENETFQCTEQGSEGSSEVSYNKLTSRKDRLDKFRLRRVSEVKKERNKKNIIGSGRLYDTLNDK